MTKDMILIIGGGSMGFAIASGIAQKDKNKKSQIIFAEKKKDRIKFLKKYKFQVFEDHIYTLKKYDKSIKIIILAIKPNELNDVLEQAKSYIPLNAVIVSILAGTTIKKLSLKLSKYQPISRVMPNTPAKINEAMSAITFNKYVKEQQKKNIIKVFQSIGQVIEVQEKYFDLVTSVSGSGPAYFCYFIECMVNAGEKLGLPYDTAYKLALQTSYGTSALLLKNNLTPKALREMVTSKKGTTEAALNIFQNSNFYNIIEKAISQANKRAKELSKL